jgi:hypothetical protein
MAALAIPLIALGSMYVISNQEKNENKEKLTNMSNNSNKSLPNVEPIPINYPVTREVEKSNVKRYSNPNQITDKYFEPPALSPVVSNGQTQNFLSLSGQTIGQDEFKHNNMMPYFGAKIRGATVNANVNESILDNMQGAGSQTFSKKEVAPLFKPQEHVQWTHGAPNQSDFFQSRVNPGLRMANVKPWEEEKVAPGLNLGYTTSGSGNGFNSGTEARETWLPKTVDELRIKTNPKLTYGLDGHQGPAQSIIKNRGIEGKVEKHLPDTYYNNTPDRWFTTTGIEKAQTARGIEVLHDVNRPFTNAEYFGSGRTTNGEACYAPQNYKESFKTETQVNDMPAPNYVGKGNAREGDYGMDSYKILPNNRNTTSYSEMGIFSGVAKAVIAPILDILRPTRKENVVGNLRTYENASSRVPSGNVYNPNDRTKTTHRETTEDKLDNNHLNFTRQTADAYLVSEQQPIDNNRDTTNTSYTGISGGFGTQTGIRTYDAEYNQRNNPNKTYVNRPNQGGTQIFNQNENIKIDKLDSDRDNNRWWVRSSGPTVPNAIPSIESYGKVIGPQEYNQGIAVDRMQPDILTAFKQNPYTQSLNSWA